MYKVGREVEVEPADAVAFSVIGPAGARSLGVDPPSDTHSHRSFAMDGIEARAVWTTDGLDLLVPQDRAADLATALEAAGVPGVDEAAAEILRVESGHPRLGREMTTETMPAEAGIVEQAVSFTKGCYIGQETVARLHYRGKPNRRLRGLRLAGPARGGDSVLLGDREVGRIGTAVVSPAYGPIALAVLRREADPGATVTVGDAATSAEVVELPFGPASGD
jgi:folate-binding protein YgfZ